MTNPINYDYSTLSPEIVSNERFSQRFLSWIKNLFSPSGSKDKDALVVIDMQNGFILKKGEGEGDSIEEFPVTDAKTIITNIVELIHEYAKNNKRIILSSDWHPEDHESFDNVTTDANKGPYPKHCVGGTKGAQLHNDIVKALIESGALEKGLVTMCHKGCEKKITKASGGDYSICNAEHIYRVQPATKSDDNGNSIAYYKLNEIRTFWGGKAVNFEKIVSDFGIATFNLVGLALDFCVIESAKGIVSLFKKTVNIISNAVKGAFVNLDAQKKLVLNSFVSGLSQDLQSVANARRSILDACINKQVTVKDFNDYINNKGIKLDVLSIPSKAVPNAQEESKPLLEQVNNTDSPINSTNPKRPA